MFIIGPGAARCEKSKKEVLALLFRYIPYLYRLVIPCRGNVCPIRRPCDCIHLRSMTTVGEEHFPGSSIPDVYFLVQAPRSNVLTIGRPGHGSHSPVMACADVERDALLWLSSFFVKCWRL